MNTDESQAQSDFLITGARTYLDVDDAMEEFRRLIQEQSRRVVLGRIGDLKRVCEQEWSANDVRRYSESGAEFFQVGHKLGVKELGSTYGGLYFCLKLYRDGNRNHSLAVAFLYHERKDLAVSLWDSFTDGGFENSSISDWNIFFARPLSEDNIPEFGRYLDQAIVDLIAFIEKSGGLRKHLGQGA
jgi:hypothetical protein